MFEKDTEILTNKKVKYKKAISQPTAKQQLTQELAENQDLQGSRIFCIG